MWVRRKEKRRKRKDKLAAVELQVTVVGSFKITTCRIFITIMYSIIIIPLVLKQSN